MKKLTTIILFFSLLIFTGCVENQSVNADTNSCPVVRVVDGDTIIVDRNGTEERVRLIGIDTPESVHPDASKNVEYGKIASNFTKEKLEDQTVTLEYDVQERDQYGRLLAYVYLDGVMFNKTLLEEGHAKVATYPPNVKYVDEFTALQEQARKDKKGVWAYDALEQGSTVSDSSANQSEEVYIGNSNTMKFHRLDCRYADQIKTEHKVVLIDRTDAVDQGYASCKVCNP